MLALIAAQEAAVIASGHGSPLTSPIGYGTVDGFAAGTLLSGVVFMLILAQRRALRRPVRAGASAAPAGQPAQEPPMDDGLGQNLPQPLAAPVEMAARAPAEMRASVPTEMAARAPAEMRASVPVEMAARAPAEMEANASAEAAALALFGAAAAASVQPEPSARIEVAALAPADETASVPVDSAPWAPVEPPAFVPVTDADLSTHPYADISPYGCMNSSTEFMPFADAANEILLQPGVRLEEWLEGQMRRPSLPRSGRVAAAELDKAEHEEERPPAPVPSAVVAAEATTAVVPATPAPEAVEEDDTAHHRRAPAYQSKHRLAGRNDSKPWPESHRRPARHAAASSARSGAMSRMFSLRQLRPVSAGD
jgi:hypothetical protein